jgi:hypothetical protein
MKSIILSGTQVTAFCPKCDEFCPSTYAYGSFPFDSGVVADRILRATCDRCGTINALAQQSAPALKEALDRSKIQTTMRTPQELLDFVNLQLDRAGGRLNHYDLYIRAILLACKNDRTIASRLREISDPVLDLPANTTINIALTTPLYQILQKIVESSGLNNASETIRRLIVLSEEPKISKRVHSEAERLCLAL